MIGKLYNKIKGVCTKVCTIVGRLFGIKVRGPGDYDVSQVVLASFVFIAGLPFGMFFMGHAFPIGIWLNIILACLIVINFDKALEMVGQDQNQEIEEY